MGRDSHAVGTMGGYRCIANSQDDGKETGDARVGG